MKLATLNDGSRDGSLVVVSRDLSRCVAATDIAPTLQAALDAWDACGPRLDALFDDLQEGRIDGDHFDQNRAHSPLPRAYQWADGSAYVNHVALVRQARGAEMPDSFWTDPLMYQGGSDDFTPPRAPIAIPDESWGIDMEAEVAVITDDVRMGVSTEDAAGHIGDQCRQRMKGKPVIGQMFIQVIRDHHHLFMRADDIGQRAQFGGAVAHAGGVGGRVDDHPAGARGDGGGKTVRCHLQTIGKTAGDIDRGAAGDLDNAGKADPIGGRDHHLVTFLDRGHQRVEQHLLATGTDRDIFRREGDAVLTFEFADDGGFQFGDAVNLCIAGMAVADGAHGGITDMRRGGKIGLAGGKADDIAPGGAQVERQRRDRHGGRRRNAVHPVGKTDGGGVDVFWRVTHAIRCATGNAPGEGGQSVPFVSTKASTCGLKARSRQCTSS